MSSNSSRYRYLFANVFAFLCGNLGTKLIGFVMVPLYTNVLSSAEYGQIDLILSIAGVISPFVACGIHEGIMRFSLDKNADQKLVLSIGLRIFLISALLFGILCPFLKLVPLIADDVPFLFAYCILNEFMAILFCYIRGKDNIKLYSFLGFLSALFTATLNIAFLLFLKMGIQGYKASMLLSPLFTSLIAILVGKIGRDLSVNRWESKLAMEMMKYSFILIPNAILWWCINASDRFFVSYMCGVSENGIYAVSYKLPTLLSTVAAIFMQSWQMSAIKEHQETGASPFYNSVYRAMILFMGAATLGLLLLNRTVLEVYVGSEYRGAWVYSPPLMISFFAGSLATFWGSFYIAAKKMNRYMVSAAIGAIVNVAMNFGLITLWGTIGAAIATAISYAIVLFVRIVGINEDVKIKILNWQAISTVLCLTVGTIACYLPSLWSWGIGIGNIIVYTLLNIKEVKVLVEFACKIVKLRKMR